MIELYEEPEYALYKNLCSSLKMRWITQAFFLDKVREEEISERFLFRALRSPNSEICNGAFIALSRIEGEHITKVLMSAIEKNQSLGPMTDFTEMVKQREDFFEILGRYINEGDVAFSQLSD